MNHVMLDLETMGTHPNSAIISIGAVTFDPNSGELGREFYKTISLESSVNWGLELDPSTIIWWMGQEDKARQECVSGTNELPLVLRDFISWIPEDAKVWGCGVAFDNTILANAYRKVGLGVPWQFWNDRCYRTMKSLVDFPAVREGVHHNALDDAKTQAKHLIKIMKHLRGDV